MHRKFARSSTRWTLLCADIVYASIWFSSFLAAVGGADESVKLSQELVWEGTQQATELAATLSQSKDTVRTLFWNIRRGELGAADRIRTGSSALDQNLRALIRGSLRPDILVLAECTPNSLELKTFEELDRAFPGYQGFYGYNPNHPNFGICVWSRFKQRAETFLSPMDWIPSGASSEEALHYRRSWTTRPGVLRQELTGRSVQKIHLDVSAGDFERTFIHTTFQVPSAHGLKDFHLFPVHLLQPWDFLRRRNGEILGFLSIGYALLFDDASPLVNQLRNFKRLFYQRLGYNVVQKNFIVIGDFNVPGSKLASGYRVAAAGLKDVFGFMDSFTPSFPTPSAPEHGNPPMQLDHAFVNEKTSLDGAHILCLKGSDHFAIGVKARLL